MSMTDPIADLLTRIRNGYVAKHEQVEVTSSTVKQGILKVLKEEGYIVDYTLTKDKKQGMLSIKLKYYGDGMEAVVNTIKRISRPGLRKYAKSEKMPRVLNGLGTMIVSTSKGIMTGKKAKSLNIGGELLCKLW